MIKKYLYPALVIGSLLTVAAILFFHKPDPIPTLQPRRGDLSLGGEWTNTKQAVDGLLAELRANPDNTKARLQLAEAYIQEGRITGNHAYYDGAALELLNQVLRREPDNFEALCCQATVLLSQHHFQEALNVASHAKDLNPANSYIYGLLCDAQVELGNYPAAVQMADQMVATRPDLRSYSRISYLREIHGDVPGAIEAMRMAAQAGYPGLEQTAWAQVNLGHLYEVSGDLKSAEGVYELALAQRPRYPFALAGQARIKRAQGDLPAAIALLEEAKGIVPDFAFTNELGDTYRQAGATRDANQCAEQVVGSLSNKVGDEENPTHGHYADRELALAYVKTGDLDNALKHALIEYERRPNNIDVLETVAWVRYRRGEFAQARPLIERALRTHSRNPVLLCRAGLILNRAGQPTQGRELVRQAFAQTPYFDAALAAEAKPLLGGVVASAR